MKKDREELEAHILERVREIKETRKKVHKVNSELKENGIPLGTFEDIAKGEQELSLISESLLCILTDAIFKVTGYEDMTTENWFSEREIESSKENIKELYKNDKRIYLPIVIEDVKRIKDDSYITTIKMSYLVQMLDSQLIYYDFDTQRSAVYTLKRDGVVPIPDVNLSSVKDIASNMVNESYLEDMITLNVYSVEDEPFNYNPKTKMFTINDGAVISILDGFHRLKGGSRAMTINGELDLEMILSIRSYDTETAQRYFGQINTINPVKVERREELLSVRYSDLVVKELQKKSDFKNGKIASAPKISEITGQLTTFSVMSYGIESAFELKSNLDVIDVSEYLIKFYNYLLGSFVDEFLLHPRVYKETMINHPLMFLGYTVIAKHFLDTERPLKQIKEYINGIDFRDEKLIEIFEDKGRRGINSRVLRNKVIAHFKNLIKKGEMVINE